MQIVIWSLETKKNDQYTCLFFAAEIGTISPVKIWTCANGMDQHGCWPDIIQMILQDGALQLCRFVYNL